MTEIRSIDAGASEVRLAWGETADDVLVLPNYLLDNPVLRQYRAPADQRKAIHLEVLQAPCPVSRNFAFGRLAQMNGGKPLDPLASKLTAPQIRHSVVALLSYDAAVSGARDYTIAIGVPMMDYPSKASRHQFGAQFMGTYRVRFGQYAHPDMQDAGEILFRVSGVVVVCEGDGALYVVPDTRTQFRAVADFGGSTADIPVYERAEDGVYDLQNELCGSGKVGLNQAMDEIAGAVGRHLGLAVTRSMVEEAISSHGCVLTVGTDTVNIFEDAAPFLYPVAVQAAVLLKETWQRVPGIGTFELIGGGSAILFEQIQSALKAAFAPDPVRFRLRLVENPRLVNVLGFWLQAKEMVGNG